MFWVIFTVAFTVVFTELLYLCVAGIVFFEESEGRGNQLAFVRAVMWPWYFIVWLKTLDWSRED